MPAINCVPLHTVNHCYCQFSFVPQWRNSQCEAAMGGEGVCIKYVVALGSRPGPFVYKAGVRTATPQGRVQAAVAKFTLILFFVCLDKQIIHMETVFKDALEASE